ncbi:MAG: glycosyltransferase family 87 protein [Candidatus Methylumidiphilus sp.]
MNFPQEHALPTASGIARQAAAPQNRIGWPRGLFLALVALFLLGLGYSTVYRTAWNDIERTDFTVYSAVGQAVLDGANIYEAHNSRGWYYVYPPPFAVFMPVFAKLPLAWGSGLWYFVSLLAVVWSALWAVRLAREANPALSASTDGWLLCEVPVFLASPWLASGLMRCQASEFMVGLVIAAVYFWQRGRPALGGASLAAATLIKAFPLALLAYFVWRRQWRFTVSFFLSLLLGALLLPGLVFGWQKNLDYWAEWGQLVAGPALSVQQQQAPDANKLYAQLLDAKKPRNQSLESLLLTFHTPPPLVKPVWAGLALAMLAWMLWQASKADAASQLLVASAFLVWNLLIPPISESHYFGLMLLPLAVLTPIALGDADRLARRLAYAALLLFFVATLWSNLDKDMHLYRFLCWGSLAVWGCLMVLAQRRIQAAP